MQGKIHNSSQFWHYSIVSISWSSIFCNLVTNAFMVILNVPRVRCGRDIFRLSKREYYFNNSHQSRLAFLAVPIELSDNSPIIYPLIFIFYIYSYGDLTCDSSKVHFTYSIRPQVVTKLTSYLWAFDNFATIPFYCRNAIFLFVNIRKIWAVLSCCKIAVITLDRKTYRKISNIRRTKSICFSSQLSVVFAQYIEANC